MRHYHTLIAHGTDDCVNENLRKLITAHADLSAQGRRTNWYYEWRHDHVDVYFRSKEDCRHFAGTFEWKHQDFLRKHGIEDPYFYDPNYDENAIDALPDHEQIRARLILIDGGAPS